MKHWQLVLMLAAMLCIGVLGGMAMTQTARAEDPPKNCGRYQVIMLQRTNEGGPLAIWLDSQTGKHSSSTRMGQQKQSSIVNKSALF
ncbi:MAG TPA: hypothetical protein PLZ36_16165 [Armatimonadota bacterium]|nr:hypothetical protein [Armatimonadota bacterium]HOS42701.1 hypothetical protein [Armatimonadota bacterium]